MLQANAENIQSLLFPPLTRFPPLRPKTIYVIMGYCTWMERYVGEHAVIPTSDMIRNLVDTLPTPTERQLVLLSSYSIRSLPSHLPSFSLSPFCRRS